MTTARPKEGPRAPLFYLITLLPGWLNLAAAQTVELSDLEICAGLDTAELKLACFEAIVATGRRTVTRDADADLEASTNADVVVEAGKAPVPVAVAAEPATTAVSGLETGTEVATQPAPAATSPNPQTEVAAATPPEIAATATADSFGSEHLKQETPDEPAVLSATVVEVNKTSRGALVFHLDNGQIWRQIEPRYYPYPRGREFDVTISTGMLGEYRLQVEGAGRRVTIRRVK